LVPPETRESSRIKTDLLGWMFGICRTWPRFGNGHGKAVTAWSRRQDVGECRAPPYVGTAGIGLCPRLARSIAAADAHGASDPCPVSRCTVEVHSIESWTTCNRESFSDSFNYLRSTTPTAAIQIAAQPPAPASISRVHSDGCPDKHTQAAELIQMGVQLPGQ